MVILVPYKPQFHYAIHAAIGQELNEGSIHTTKD